MEISEDKQRDALCKYDCPLHAPSWIVIGSRQKRGRVSLSLSLFLSPAQPASDSRSSRVIVATISFLASVREIDELTLARERLSSVIRSTVIVVIDPSYVGRLASEKRERSLKWSPARVSKFIYT